MQQHKKLSIRNVERDVNFNLNLIVATSSCWKTHEFSSGSSIFGNHLFGSAPNHIFWQQKIISLQQIFNSILKHFQNWIRWELELLWWQSNFSLWIITSLIKNTITLQGFFYHIAIVIKHTTYLLKMFLDSM